MHKKEIIGKKRRASSVKKEAKKATLNCSGKNDYNLFGISEMNIVPLAEISN